MLETLRHGALALSLLRLLGGCSEKAAFKPAQQSGALLIADDVGNAAWRVTAAAR